MAGPLWTASDWMLAGLWWHGLVDIGGHELKHSFSEQFTNAKLLAPDRLPYLYEQACEF
ncbi:MAG: hypothetical protein AAF065_07045 [Verrucomicrobiota bacterium]